MYKFCVARLLLLINSEIPQQNYKSTPDHSNHLNYNRTNKNLSILVVSPTSFHTSYMHFPTCCLSHLSITDWI